MEIEHIARIRLAAGRTAQDEGYLTVGHSVLGEVVIDHEGIPSRVTEILPDRSSGKRGVILERGSLARRRYHHHGIVHRALRTKRLHYIGNSASLLSHSHIDTIHRLSGEIIRTLVDDGVYGNGRLSGLTVTDDQLPLSPSDRNHRIDALEAGLQRLAHGLAENDSGSLALKRHLHEVAPDLPESVQRVAERVHHPSEYCLPHPDAGNPSGAPHHHTLLHGLRRTKKHRTHIVLLKVHRDTGHAALEVEQFARLGIFEPIYARNAVTDLQDLSYFIIPGRNVYAPELLQQHIRDFARLGRSLYHLLKNTFLCFYQSAPDHLKLTPHGGIQKAVSRHYDRSPDDVGVHRRLKAHVLSRHAARLFPYGPQHLGAKRDSRDDARTDNAVGILILTGI